jgi:hypothetical protein
LLPATKPDATHVLRTALEEYINILTVYLVGKVTAECVILLSLALQFGKTAK